MKKYGKILKMENHLNAVLVLYTKNAGVATCIFDRKKKTKLSEDYNTE